ncbi:MAG: hypothetical protein JWN75_973 [Candidatus Saccharibacteria bacterium]|nr:hypothetical protein [Candidatus Saccharibacteria bacterium]
MTSEDGVAVDVPVTLDELDSDDTAGAPVSEELGAGGTAEDEDEPVFSGTLLADVGCSDVVEVAAVVEGTDELALVGADAELVTNGAVDEACEDDDAGADDSAAEGAAGAAEDAGALVSEEAEDVEGITLGNSAVGCTVASVDAGAGGATLGSDGTTGSGAGASGSLTTGGGEVGATGCCTTTGASGTTVGVGAAVGCAVGTSAVGCGASAVGATTSVVTGVVVSGSAYAKPAAGANAKAAAATTNTIPRRKTTIFDRISVSRFIIDGKELVTRRHFPGLHLGGWLHYTIF